MITDLARYIHSHYGTCEQAEQTDKCECLYKQQDQRACAHYEPTTAATWEELLAQARERYKQHKEQREDRL